MALTTRLAPNRIVQFFANKTILITGASGFLGQVLLEKLLHSCTPLLKIYVIIREKKGKDAQERLREIFNGPLFERVKHEHGADIFRKVEAISGDASALDLGLSPEDRRKLVEETEIIYHTAATIRFDEPLKDTILLNVRGTKLMLELAKECPGLKVFCYVSTAYCHEDQEVLAEKFYPSKGDPGEVVQLSERLDRETMEGMGKELRGVHVNNYSFSKSLAEALVEARKDTLPVVIQRPSVVIPIWKEPIPGWTDNMNGPMGLLVGAGKGVIRTMYAREDIFVDCVPVDVIANALIMTTYDFCTNRTRQVYNLTASEESEKIGVTAKKVLELGKTIVTEKLPFSMVLWYPNGSLKRSRLAHCIAFVLFQLLPALCVDSILWAVGVKPFLVKVQRKVWKGYQRFEYYANRKWAFVNQNVLAVHDQLNSTEREMFKFDSEGFVMYDYCVDCTAACRRYLLKEPDGNIPAALKRMKMLKYLDLFCKIAFFAGLVYYAFSKFVLTRRD